MLGWFFNVSDRHWIDPKHVTDRLFVFIRNKMIDTKCISDRTCYDMYWTPLGVEQ